MYVWFEFDTIQQQKFENFWTKNTFCLHPNIENQLKINLFGYDIHYYHDGQNSKQWGQPKFDYIFYCDTYKRDDNNHTVEKC